MNHFTEFKIPTTETVPKDLPHVDPDELALPHDANTLLLAGILSLGVLAACYAAGEVILPIVLAFVLKLLLQPGMRLLERIYMPRPLAALLIILAMLGGIFAVFAAVSGPATSWVERLPESLPKIEERLRFLSDPLATAADMLRKIDHMGQPGGSESKSLGLTDMLFRGTQHFASGLFETLLILFFLLISGDMFLRRLVEIMPTFKDKRQVVELSQQIESNVSAYLLTITAMNALVGFATGIVMWLCGVGEPLLWGSIAFLLNFVPIIGPAVGVGLFLFVGLLAIPSFGQALAPAGLYLIIHVAEGETITPMLLARRFTLNPVLVIISLIFWFWMWGVPGAILSVPMLAIAKIVCDGVKPLNTIGHFLEGESGSQPAPN
jgi:predicted PurR-regulated permease PerM